MVPTWYWTPGDSGTLLVSQLFRDPEGSPVFFDPAAATNTDIWVCDVADAGDLDIDATPTDPGRPDGTQFGPGTTVAFTGADNAGCSVSNPARTADPLPGAKGAAGNRVVSTSRTGPVLTLERIACRYHRWHYGNRSTSRYLRGDGIRPCVVTGVAANPALSPASFAQVNIQVKIGANNIPQFAGGATGYMVGDERSWTTIWSDEAWVAGDLDEVV